jgi:CHAD domain-containing protein
MLAFRIKPSRDRRATKFARRATEDARREIERRRSAEPATPEELHRLRIAYKRLRYTVETFSGVLPSDLAALAQPAARQQNRLGRLHDIDMAIACVRAARSLSDAGREALLGALEAARRERAASIAHDLGTPVVAPAAAG